MTLYINKNDDECENIETLNREEDSTFGHNVRKFLREYNDVTGIHGLRYLTEKRSTTEKIFWAIVVIFSLGWCVYMILEILDKYENSPIVVTFGTKCTPIHEIPFPTVTICPEARYSGDAFNFSRIYNNLVKKQYSENITDADLQRFFHLSLVCENQNEFQFFSNRTVDDGFFATIDKLKPKSNTLKYCAFMGRSISCRHLFNPILTDQGLCYSFNMLNRSKIFKDDVYQYKNFFVTKANTSDYDLESGYSDDLGLNTYPQRALTSGEDNGLIVFFSYDISDTDFICSSFYQGWRVSIHSPFDIPRMSKNYFRVPLDKVVVAAIEPEVITTSKEVRNFVPEKRKCFMVDERPLQHFRIYTQANCMLECVTNYTLLTCGCVAFHMPRENGTRICGTDMYKCITHAEKELKLQNLEAEISGTYQSKMICNCKPSCAHLKFKTETSHSNFYFNRYFEAHHSLKAFDDNINHWSILSIYFKNEDFIPIQRNQLYGISDLISNFGGLLGLFTGFSLISLAEIVYFLTLRLFYNEKIYGKWSGPSQKY